MSESKTKSNMIFHGFLLGLTGSSTVIYGYALFTHWASGLRTSAIDELVFIATILSTCFYAQAFWSSYQAYQRIYSQALPTITMYIPSTPVTDKTQGFVSPGSSATSPGSTTIGTPMIKLPGTPIVFTLPGSGSSKPSSPNLEGKRRMSDDSSRGRQSFGRLLSEDSVMSRQNSSENLVGLGMGIGR